MKIGGLCEGYGGLTRGLQSVLGGEVAWHFEYDKHPAAILEHRFPGVPNYRDITAHDFTGIERVDWLTAGYPCQPFSHAGKRQGANDERHLWPDVLRAVGALRPRGVLLENVAGHVSLGLDRVLWDLAAVGYDATWSVVRASDAGAPHGRARVFIVAVDADSSAYRQPVADTNGERLERVGRIDTERRDADGCGGQDAAWGAYEPAIRRWERVTGRSTPRPTEPGRNGERLSPAFVEWMMGLPAGWVTDVPGLPRNAQLKALGNGVVPQQAALALRLLLPLAVAA